jgi:hypothetical protein
VSISIPVALTTALLVAALGIAAGVQTYRLRGAQAEIALLDKDVASARANAVTWQTIASRHRTTIDAQADLAEACLIREEQYIHDAAEIAAILSADEPVPETPETPVEQKKGVSDAVRRAVAAYLNRPL